MGIPRIGKYEVLGRLGQGGMGSVYLGRDPDLDRRVALKRMHGLMPDDAFRARFLREARAAAGLRHPNIVTVYDVGEHDGEPFIAMEYVDGETLVHLIDRAESVPLDVKLHIIDQLCTGLHFAHRAGIVHRDVKPANVMIDRDGLVRILDFGIARTLDASLTAQGAVIGSLNYMAPEQLGGGRVDGRADVFAAGAVAYELFSGRRAFGGGVEDGIIDRIARVDPPPISDLVRDMDPEADAIVRRALAKDPARRYQTIDGMANDVRRLRARLMPAGTAAAVMEPTRVLTPAELTSTDIIGTGERSVPAFGVPVAHRGVLAATVAVVVASVLAGTLFVSRSADEPAGDGATAEPVPPSTATPPSPSPAPSNPRTPIRPTARDREAPPGSPTEFDSRRSAAEASAQLDPRRLAADPSSREPDNDRRGEPEEFLATPPDEQAAPPPREDAVASSQLRIAEILDSYARAYASRSAAAVKAVVPSLSPQEIAALDRGFLDASSYQVVFEGVQIAVTGELARVSAIVRERIVPIAGQPRNIARPAVITLDRSGGDWVITEVRRR